jgi:hypothetical protein
METAHQELKQTFRSDQNSSLQKKQVRRVTADVRFWHKADITIVLNHVRFGGKADIWAIVAHRPRFMSTRPGLGSAGPRQARTFEPSPRLAVRQLRLSIRPRVSRSSTAALGEMKSQPDFRH